MRLARSRSDETHCRRCLKYAEQAQRPASAKCLTLDSSTEESDKGRPDVRTHLHHDPRSLRSSFDDDQHTFQVEVRARSPSPNSTCFNPPPRTSFGHRDRAHSAPPIAVGPAGSAPQNPKEFHGRRKRKKQGSLQSSRIARKPSKCRSSCCANDTPHGPLQPCPQHAAIRLRNDNSPRDLVE